MSRHFVLVHDAGQGAWVWYKLATRLETAGHRVTTLDMAGSGISDTPPPDVTTFEEYSTPLLDFMRDDVPAGEKVVLVGHGLGGMNVALAMERYREKVAVGVFVNAFIPDTINNPSHVIEEYARRYQNFFLDTTFPGFPPKSMNFGPNYLKGRLYQHCSAEDFTMGRKLHRLAQFFQDVLAKQPAFSSGRYGSVPRIAIDGQNDLAFPDVFQTWQIGLFPLTNNTKVLLPNTDHQAMLSNPVGLSNSLLSSVRPFR